MKRISLIYGFWIGVGLIVYFLLIRLIGLQEEVMLSAVNGIIFAIGLYIALNRLRSREPNMAYETGFAAGMVSGSIATGIFTVFMALYMYQIDLEFPRAIMEQWNMEESLSTAMLLLMILTMGAVTTLVLTLSYMQLFKRSWNEKKPD